MTLQALRDRVKNKTRRPSFQERGRARARARALEKAALDKLATPKKKSGTATDTQKEG